MTLKVLCSKRAAGVGRLRAKACFKVSMLRLQSSASFSNLLRRHCSGPGQRACQGRSQRGGHLLNGFSNVAQVGELCGVV